MNNRIRYILVVLNSFLAFTAITGGIGLLTGLNAPPLDFLAGSPFSNYTIPGCALLVLVGGTSVFAVTLLVRKDNFAWFVVVASSVLVIIFEAVEIYYIGSPDGAARLLQIFYSTLGLVIGILGFTFRTFKK